MPMESAAGSIGPNVATPASVAQNNPLNPETISLAVLAVGMLLIALVAVGGFTVLAQRRLRSLGMLATIGATDKQCRTGGAGERRRRRGGRRGDRGRVGNGRLAVLPTTPRGRALIT